MRTRPLYVATFFATVFITSPLQAQDWPPRTYPVVLKAANSSTVHIKFEGIDGESVNSPRDVASGQATGKRQHSPLMAQTPFGVWEELSIVVKREPVAGSVVVYATITMDGGGTCRARTQATYNASSKRFEISLGDAARFFGANT